MSGVANDEGKQGQRSTIGMITRPFLSASS